MKTLVDARLVREARSSELRFRCDDCAHFDHGSARCAHGYPVSPHRPVPLEVAVVIPGAAIVFCKEFELGGEEPP